MALSKQQFSDYIKQFNFLELFNDMGWNNDKTKQPIVVDNDTYTLQAVAEKSGFKILLCNPLSNGVLPDYNTRKKIETKITKLFQEHLIIFFDTKKTEQIWQLVVRQSGKPTKVTETRWHINQDPELLYQRAAGIFFELDEEEHITIIDVTKRIADNFNQNNERVTKQFYDKFKKEHGAFLQFIKGIADKSNQEWYASLMLNRLMFCYFIQKKGFLDNNKNYLRDKLTACKAKKGKAKFYSFYRDFLLVLFHKGLNESFRSADTNIEIGTIPYLNGGLFDEHELEKNNTNIDIDDKAFERLFDFFDQYEWHLDTRHTASGKDINPDVIGYIFEKYINDRANMGAYYTKEDITDYISKNCILPYLFDETKRNYPKAFHADGEVWHMVQRSGDTYIYDAVKKGVHLPLPEHIAIGADTTTPNLIARRKDWNTTAPGDYALPTEIWREVVERRNRYTTIKTTIDNGSVQHINDFITYNLNIRQFAQDVIENTNDPELIKHFYKALNSVTIIDPTCGSGAFLFAAMNILEPLYESCIMRMRGFTEDEDRENADDKKNFKNKYKFFREVLENIQSPQHPNLQYFIYKSIILRNLYGVDIMKEAVEIAKLRLFLKLVATVEANYRKPNLGLEPLPDIDFNIRAGNTLVGFATEAELDTALVGKLDYDNDKEKIKEQCDIVAHAYARYKDIQLTHGDDFKEFRSAKEELNKRLKTLNHELNHILHKQANGLKFNQWLQTHQPFHWFAEYYEIIHGKGGFDVIIGNPPYVVTRSNPLLSNYLTNTCNNLYAYVIERSRILMNQVSRFGFIVPMPSLSTPQMSPLQGIIRTNNSWISNYDERPSKLFDGVDQRLTIIIQEKCSNLSKVTIYSSGLFRWYSIFREFLFETIYYSNVDSKEINSSRILKFKSNVELNIHTKFLKHGFISRYFSNNINNFISYRSAGGRYWKTFLPNEFEVITTSSRKIFLNESLSKFTFIAAYSSSFFWWYYTTNYDMFNFQKYIVNDFRFNYPDNDASKVQNKLDRLGKNLSNSLEQNATREISNRNTTGKVETVKYRISLSKSIIDEIDTVLAEHYGFTEEELDFLINYDIKYRMGNQLDGEDEE
jgi:hypothetical protein